MHVRGGNETQAFWYMKRNFVIEHKQAATEGDAVYTSHSPLIHTNIILNNEGHILRRATMCHRISSKGFLDNE